MQQPSEQIANIIRVVVVEDHEITRMGLKLTLEQHAGIRVVGEAADGKQGIETVLATKPHVVLMDIGLPMIDGIQATQTIKQSAPQVRIIILTSHDSDRDIFAALAAGADGYCLKETPTNQLALAIRTVAEGAAGLDPGIAGRVLKASVIAGMPEPRRSADSPESKQLAARLSQREIEVLKLVVDGMSNQQIADRLVVSVETVKTHMRRLMEKLAVSDRTQAAVKAMRDGLL